MDVKVNPDTKDNNGVCKNERVTGLVRGLPDTANRPETVVVRPGVPGNRGVFIMTDKAIRTGNANNNYITIAQLLTSAETGETLCLYASPDNHIMRCGSCGARDLCIGMAVRMMLNGQLGKGEVLN
jgi:hypothetical protein